MHSVAKPPRSWLLVLAGLCVSMTAPLPGRQDESPGAAEISGQVVDASTGRPLGGALVTVNKAPDGDLYIPMTLPGYIAVFTLDEHEYGPVLTAADGQFRFGQLPAGAFEVEASKPGWIGGRVGQRNWLAADGTPLRSGRDFRFADRGQPLVAIVNEAMAKHYCPGVTPLGRVVRFDGEAQLYEIVGVVADAKYDSLRVAPPRTIYLNAFQDNRIQSQFSLLTTVNPLVLVDEVRRAVNGRLTALPVVDVRTLGHQMEATLVPERLVARLSGVFGAIAVILTSLGLYSLLAYSTARRIGEIGLRMALGASTRHVLWMIVRRAVILAVAGLALGLPVAEWSRHLAASMVTNLTNAPVALLGLAGLTILVVTAVAAAVPARRAARVEPVRALRQQE